MSKLLYFTYLVKGFNELFTMVIGRL